MYKTPKETRQFIEQFQSQVKNIQHKEVIICPPFISIPAAVETLGQSMIQVGAQDAHFCNDGAYTGNISPVMLKEIGVRYVIIGHSERRQEGENDEIINRKIKNVLNNGLKVIFCVGETLIQREKNATESVLQVQLMQGLQGIAVGDLSRIIIAYEPVWAIGTGKTATPSQANDVHQFIRQIIGHKYSALQSEEIRIQYGGSVKPENIQLLMKQPDIDGVLVGGASLQVDSFLKIIHYDQTE